MIGYPLDSHVDYKADGTPIWDRAISSAPLRELFKKLFSDGVLPNPSTNMQVAAGTGMQINVSPGFAMCNGCMKLSEVNTLLDLSNASMVNDRIDTVVLRLDDNENKRECEFYILTGTPETTPTAPKLTRSDSIWELGLANILVKANSTQVSNANITDTRYDSARCGIISSISEFDTTTLYQQIVADLEEFQNVNQAEFEAWFTNIKGQLEGDAAANLQKQIGTLSELKTEEKTDLVKAINEVAKKEVDVLDTEEEILANTENGKVAGAKGVKEIVTGINSRLGGNNLIYNESEDAYYIQHGADSVPKKLGSIPHHSVVELSAGKSYTLPIDPKEILYIAAFGKMGNITALRTYKVGHGYDYRGTDGTFRFQYSDVGFAIVDSTIIFTAPTVFGAKTGTWTFMWS